MKLTLQIQQQNLWRDAASIELPEPSRGRAGRLVLEYLQDYAINFMGETGIVAASVTAPVELMRPYSYERWPAFIEDIMPMGAGRRHWVARLGLDGLPAHEQDATLLAQAAIAPVGNLRIKEAVPQKVDYVNGDYRFTVDDVVERQHDFLEYAQDMGAVSGGATGATGEAPKLLLRQTADQQIWIDTWQDEAENTDAQYLVKFPRGRRTERDADILRAEYHYYQELVAMGFNTIPTEEMKLLEGSQSPSLWLPRFDVTERSGKLGLESVYALLNKPAGTELNHIDTLRTLSEVFRPAVPEFDIPAFIIEWLCRDLLNIAFGNSDNHGRNTAFLKTAQGIELAPIYDFAPMKADHETVVRTTKWGQPLERGGDYDWQGIVQAVDGLVDADAAFAALQDTAQKLVGLKARLKQRGVPSSIVEMPNIGFGELEAKLKRWQLL